MLLETELASDMALVQMGLTLRRWMEEIPAYPRELLLLNGNIHRKTPVKQVEQIYQV
ncbi:hypothetical protein GCM10010965_26910 [Caldalkalibacillus thermarum]|nr:hypothetical protein GCM10010965_26910 [Caldalkalibacillus thermarum]